MTAQFPLVDALRFHDRHVLHAAAVEREGQAVVVLGGSGAGKSTFAYAAAHAGWGIVTDDLCIVEAGDGVYVTGFPKPVNVPSDVLAATPVDAARLAGDARDRWALPLPRSLPAGDTQCVRYCVSLTPTPMRITPPSRRRRCVSIRSCRRCHWRRCRPRCGRSSRSPPNSAVCRPTCTAMPPIRRPSPVGGAIA